MLMNDTAGQRLRHLALNGASLGAPLIGALLSMPILMRHLEPAAFSLLGMYWIIVGYASMVELGLGRSIIWRLASLEPSQAALANQTLSTALIAAVAFGALGSAILVAFLPLVFGQFISVPPQLAAANLASLWWIALSIPALTSTSVMLGALEARRQFGLIAVFRVPAGLALFVVPAIMVQHGYGFEYVMAGVLWVRMILAVALFAITSRFYPLPTVASIFSGRLFRGLIGYGGWLSLSALIGPLLVYLDRFLLSYKWGLEQTAIYTPAFESMVRLLVVASAVSGIMFPRFVACHSSQSAEGRRLYIEGNLAVALMLLPVAVIVLVFGSEIFQLWIGRTNLSTEHVGEAAAIAKILICAVVINGCAHIPQAFIQARGLARWTALLHGVELSLYIIYGPLLIFTYGIYGAASAWFVRSAISAAALYYLAWRLRRHRTEEFN